MHPFGKKETAEDAEVATPATSVEQFPGVIQEAVEQVTAEWDIFLQRLVTLRKAYSGNASKADKKKILSHAKQAAMCVRFALKEFGRVSG